MDERGPMELAAHLEQTIRALELFLTDVLPDHSINAMGWVIARDLASIAKRLEASDLCIG